MQLEWICTCQLEIAFRTNFTLTAKLESSNREMQSARFYLSSSFPNSRGQRFRREHSFLISAGISSYPEAQTGSMQPGTRAVSKNTEISGSRLPNQMHFTGSTEGCFWVIQLAKEVWRARALGIAKRSLFIRWEKKHVYGRAEVWVRTYKTHCSGQEVQAVHPALHT